ncbi:DNA-binding IscR family transcriptional regulator [Actinoplanes octamycinicus]|uniref:DNA-binding IscR family transcriptional regulator n=1 Tax=Actinoplanes octamycinicus TaxID=135948 RepID=A0A7W7MBL1_9ACTN|nr:helix-turn-helix domain-containing protein [Actinoplanes octamycinicus]MBB4743925.1 DNA-binding IscR family transcriptional regulator [Actinoplanes octamycinicus]GIE58551.1 hypothetical protein Aoc01nite_39530 [Actinoplanes octamycinicus]
MKPPTEPAVGNAPFASGQLVKAALLASKDLTKNERMVMIAVAAHMNGAGDAYPSVATIAGYVGVSDRTVTRILAKLVALGRLIARTRKGATTIYRLAANAINQVIRAVTKRTDPRQNGRKHTTTPDTRSTSDEVAPQEVSKHLWWSRRPQQLRGAALPPPPTADRCPQHLGQHRKTCAPCRSEFLAAARGPLQTPG